MTDDGTAELTKAAQRVARERQEAAEGAARVKKRLAEAEAAKKAADAAKPKP